MPVESNVGERRSMVSEIEQLIKKASSEQLARIREILLQESRPVAAHEARPDGRLPESKDTYPVPNVLERKGGRAKLEEYLAKNGTVIPKEVIARGYIKGRDEMGKVVKDRLAISPREGAQSFLFSLANGKQVPFEQLPPRFAEIEGEGSNFETGKLNRGFNIYFKNEDGDLVGVFVGIDNVEELDSMGSEKPGKHTSVTDRKVVELSKMLRATLEAQPEFWEGINRGQLGNLFNFLTSETERLQKEAAEKKK